MKLALMLIVALMLAGCGNSEEREQQKFQEAQKKAAEELQKMHKGTDKALRVYRPGIPDSQPKEPAKGAPK